MFLYLPRYLEGLLRQASTSLIAHCPNMHCFVNHTTENEQTFSAEEYSDITGQSVLAECQLSIVTKYHLVNVKTNPHFIETIKTP